MLRDMIDDGCGVCHYACCGASACYGACYDYASATFMCRESMMLKKDDVKLYVCDLVIAWFWIFN